LFVNILDNAVKYSVSGDILVTIQQYNQLIEVRIKDKGIGISEQDLPQVFNRFFRVEKSRSKRGSGLGLAIASEIAKNHGGTIEVKSELDLGSEFIIHLPAYAIRR
jgi:two-component system phosphate regulon sensor histidine kinase PhoR